MAGLLVTPSYLELPLCWLSKRTPVTWLAKLQGIYSLAALPQLQLFRVLEGDQFRNAGCCAS
ncbi:hypothetical protein BSR04_18270 [Serratia plymuthica]|uniref:Uncharacterized protein n=1 Tax=Serratia plymuthica TaxID=82996 RepID=A0A318NY66_SERPL|nr:hypothetical protein BSR04_18270 [Serratia plymuthica]PYD38781.1 hypothetical protein CT690_13555 [Serratia plymuthica]